MGAAPPPATGFAVASRHPSRPAIFPSIVVRRKELLRRRSGGPARPVARSAACALDLMFLFGREGRLAQLVEHLVYTERVGGSSPSPPTKVASARAIDKTSQPRLTLPRAALKSAAHRRSPATKSRGRSSVG